MTEKQQYYLDMYNSEADKAYESMHDYRIDYDTFKPIADASSIMTEQSKKVYDKLYPIYINYPIFLRGLKYIYDNSKKSSDEDQEILKSKLNTLNEYRSKYDSWINKINALEVQINEDELSFQIDEIANLPENLERSNELALIEKEKEIEAARIAQEAADKAAAEKAIADKIASESATQGTTIVVDKIIGTEVCLDNFGNQIDMSICKPSSGGGGGGGSQQEKTASQIVNENIENWLKGIEETFKIEEVKPSTTLEPIVEPIAEQNPIVEPEPIVEVEPEPIVEVEPEPIVEPIVEVEQIAKPIVPEDIINSFIFKADLSKLISSELSSRQTIEAPITEDKLYPLNILNQSIEKAPTLEEFHPVDSFIYKPDLIKPIEEAPIIKEINKVVLIKNDEIKPIIEVKNSNTSINNNKENSSKIMIAAAVLAIIVSYSIIKKKD
jgi:hypothetical protein